MIGRSLSESDSIIHRLDPRVRLLAGLGLALFLAVGTHTNMLFGGLICGIALTLCARLPWRAVVRRLLWLNLVVGLLALSILYSASDDAHRALVITLRANAIMLLGTALLSTIDAARLGQALRRLGVPVGLTQLIVLTVRYADVIHNEYLRLRQAMRARGFQLRPNRHSLRTLGYLIGNLLVRSFDRAQRVLEAMRCRGFAGEFPSMKRQRMRIPDRCFAASALIVALLLSWLEYR